MSAVPKLAEHYTPDEFFDFIEQSDRKYEYEKGGLIEMAGGTSNHNVIKSDLGVFLGGHVLQNSDCEYFDSDQAVHVPTFESFVFPDLTFVCGEAQFQDEAGRRLLNPTLLVEVLSESTEAYDRGGKFLKYRSLGSFREYVLVDSRSYSIESFYKKDDKLWLIDRCTNPYESFHIHTLNLDLPLSAMYRRVKFRSI